MKIRVFVANDQASEIAEAALVLPIAFMILLAIYWFGRAFNTYATINHAAREGARVAVTQTCATCSPPNQPPITRDITATVIRTMQASSVGTGPNTIRTYIPAYTYCSGNQQNNCDSTNSNIAVCNNVQLTPNNAGYGAQACGIAVSFQYPYQFSLPFTSLNNQTIILTADVQMAREF
jgi:hypothetical protein